jgi:GNAT superfamily N-acetyltransferase
VARAIAATNRVVCTSCSQQCGLLADIADRRVTRLIGDRSHRATRGFICPKGAKAPLLHEHPHRLYVPLKIAATVQRITASHGSEALAYSYGTMRVPASVSASASCRVPERLAHRTCAPGRRRRLGEGVRDGRRQSGAGLWLLHLAAASVAHQHATERARKGQLRHPIPAVLLARLAVDASVQGHGVGAWLLQDAMRRALSAAEAVGIRVLLVHALDKNARSFYQRWGFEPSPTDPLNLQMLFKDIRKSLEPG